MSSHEPGFRPPNLAQFPWQTNLFGSFWRAAHDTWRWRGTARRAGLPFSEETITETLLLDLATRHPGEISIFAFNTRAEGRTGADWEWCFHDAAGQRFTRMLVQAKVLDNRETYAHVDRTIGNTGVRQIDRLLATARERHAPALYAFYNHLNDAGRVPLSACACFGCLECWGISVAPAGAVGTLMADGKPGAKRFDAIKAVSAPWLCLLCGQEQERHGRPPLPDAVLAALRRLLDASREALRPLGEFGHIALPEEPERDPPAYFRLRDLDGAARPEIMRVAAELPGVAGAVMVGERDER